MPSVLRHFLFFTTGISGVMYMFQGHQEVGFGFSATLVAYGLLSALASYGFISLATDIKKARSIDGVWRIIKNRALELFKCDAS